MKRTATILTVLIMMPLLMGAGGGNPGVPSAKKITGPAVTAVIVMDPHQFGTTTKAKQATIWLTKGSLTSGAVFEIPSTFALFLGCVLTQSNGSSLTDLRFLNVALNQWIPTAIVLSLFDQLGLSVRDPNNPANLNPNMVPVVAALSNDVCTFDPENPGPLVNSNSTSSQPGMLSFTATIEFEVPQ